MNLSHTFPRFAAAGAVIGTGILLAAGHAAADWEPDPLCIYSSADEKAADLADDGLENCSILDEPGTVIDPQAILPYLPEGDDDGPGITINPEISIPLQELPGNDDDGPSITIKPGLDLPLQELPEVPDTPVDPPADPPQETTTTTTQPPATQTPETPETPQTPETPVQPIAPFLRITSVAVECDGSVLVAYETGADPALAPAAEHVVSFSPTAVPSLAFSQRLVGQPLNGAFSVDVPTPTADEYLVFVVADLQPGNPEGVLLVDEAVAVAPTGCPAS